MGCVKLSTKELGVVDRRLSVEGERFELGYFLAKAIDFHGPAGLVCFLAVLRQVGGFAEDVKFVLERLYNCGRSRGRMGCCSGVGEKAVDARDASARAEALLQCSPKQSTGGETVSNSQLTDQVLDREIADVGRVHRGIVLQAERFPLGE